MISCAGSSRACERVLLQGEGDPLTDVLGVLDELPLQEQEGALVAPLLRQATGFTEVAVS